MRGHSCIDDADWVKHCKMTKADGTWQRCSMRPSGTESRKTWRILAWPKEMHWFWTDEEKLWETG